MREHSLHARPTRGRQGWHFQRTRSQGIVLCGAGQNFFFSPSRGGKLRKQCRRLVPFLFGEANPNPNLKHTWLAIMAGRARPDEPEVVGGVQEEGW